MTCQILNAAMLEVYRCIVTSLYLQTVVCGIMLQPEYSVCESPWLLVNFKVSLLNFNSLCSQLHINYIPPTWRRGFMLSLVRSRVFFSNNTRSPRQASSSISTVLHVLKQNGRKRSGTLRFRMSSKMLDLCMIFPKKVFANRTPSTKRDWTGRVYGRFTS